MRDTAVARLPVQVCPLSGSPSHDADMSSGENPVMPLPGVDALQDDHRDLARGLFPVLVKVREDVGVLGVEPLVLLTVRDVRMRFEGFALNFQSHIRMLYEVVVPGRVRWGAAL